MQNTNSGKLGIQKRSFGLGYVKSKKLFPSINTSSKFENKALKASLLPPTVDLSYLVPPVGDQYQQGSCTAWASTYYTETIEQEMLHGWNMYSPFHDFSPAFTYNQLDGGYDNGIDPYNAYTLIENKGAIPLDEFPYNASDYTTLPTQQQLSHAQQFRAFQAYSLGTGDTFYEGTPYGGIPLDVNLLKTVLAGGNVFTVAIPVNNNDFYTAPSDPNYIYNIASGDDTTVDHYITIVGYNDRLQAFKMVNSWGPEWGNNGYLWLSYSFIQNYGCEPIAMVPNTSLPSLNSVKLSNDIVSSISASTTLNLVTAGVPDGTSVNVDMVDAWQGNNVLFPNVGSGTVQNNSAKVGLSIANMGGPFYARVEVGGLAYDGVHLAFPSVTDMSFSGSYDQSSNTNKLSVTGTTADFADGTAVTIELLNSDGAQLSPPVSATSVVGHNNFTANLSVPGSLNGTGFWLAAVWPGGPGMVVFYQGITLGSPPAGTSISLTGAMSTLYGVGASYSENLVTTGVANNTPVTVTLTDLNNLSISYQGSGTINNYQASVSVSIPSNAYPETYQVTTSWGSQAYNGIYFEVEQPQFLSFSENQTQNNARTWASPEIGVNLNDGNWLGFILADDTGYPLYNADGDFWGSVYFTAPPTQQVFTGMTIPPDVPPGIYRVFFDDWAGNYYFGGASPPTYQVTSMSLAPIGNIEQPSNNQNVSGKETVWGWALDPAAVSQVNVLVDDNIVGQATYGLYRPDVGQTFPNYNNAAYSGFSYTLDTTQFANGSHTLTVDEVSNSGQENRVASVQINVSNSANLPPIGNLETPSNGQSLSGSSVTVAGWYLDSNGIGTVNVLLNGAVIGQATYGFSRPDVAKVYPSYNNPSSGFTCTINTTQISNGQYDLTIQEQDNKGQSFSLPTITVTVSNQANLPAVGNLESPAENQIVSGITTVSGWSLQGNSPCENELCVDGQYVSTAMSTLTRTDVAKVFPQYPDAATAGFSGSIDTTQWPDGVHDISVNVGTVLAVGGSHKVIVQNFPPIGNLEAPTVNVSLSGTVAVAGWFLDGAGVRQINVLVDGTLVGTASYGSQRKDVQNVFPKYPGSLDSGFTFSLLTNQLANGSHSVAVQEVSNDGLSKTLPAVSIKVANASNLPPIGCVDTPTNNQANLSGNVLVSGWFLDNATVNTININVDGVLVGTGAYGGPRPDVYSVFPGYNNKNSGFSYSLNTTALANGQHKLVVSETDKAGMTISLPQITLTVANLSPIGNLEAPANNQTFTSANVQVAGWFLDPAQVKEIDILVDGQNESQATYGSARPDVYNVFPNYGNKYSGFSASVALTSGSHTITVREVNVNGQTNNLPLVTVKITIPPFIGNLESPTNGQIVSGTGTVSGWLLDPSGVREVDIYLDNQYIGRATYGLSRPDVAKAFPQYNTVNSGFSMQMNWNNFPPAYYNLGIVEVSDSGVTNSLPVITVYIANGV